MSCKASAVIVLLIPVSSASAEGVVSFQPKKGTNVNVNQTALEQITGNIIHLTGSCSPESIIMILVDCDFCSE